MRAPAFTSKETPESTLVPLDNFTAQKGQLLCCGGF